MAKFCVSCGSSLNGGMFCVRCGAASGEAAAPRLQPAAVSSMQAVMAPSSIPAKSNLLIKF